MCVTFVTCEVRVCGLRCRSGSSFYIYRVYLQGLKPQGLRRVGAVQLYVLPRLALRATQRPAEAAAALVRTDRRWWSRASSSWIRVRAP